MVVALAVHGYFFAILTVDTLEPFRADTYLVKILSKIDLKLRLTSV